MPRVLAGILGASHFQPAIAGMCVAVLLDVLLVLRSAFRGYACLKYAALALSCGKRSITSPQKDGHSDPGHS